MKPIGTAQRESESPKPRNPTPETWSRSKIVMEYRETRQRTPTPSNSLSPLGQVTWRMSVTVMRGVPTMAAARNKRKKNPVGEREREREGGQEGRQRMKRARALS